jgi:hypothetical protein
LAVRRARLARHQNGSRKCDTASKANKHPDIPVGN